MPRRNSNADDYAPEPQHIAMANLERQLRDESRWKRKARRTWQTTADTEAAIEQFRRTYSQGARS